MNMKEDIAKRILSEQAGLVDRRAKLSEFMETEEFKQLKPQYQCLLHLQSKTMEQYNNILSERLYGGYTAPTLSFGLAIEAMKQGYPVSRISWNNKNLMVIKQVPAMIGKTIIHNMTSLPQQAKDKILETTECITYTNQCLLFSATSGRADSWSPTVSDIFAQDWVIIF
jgi:Protein of unknown function (DUF2829)